MARLAAMADRYLEQLQRERHEHDLIHVSREPLLNRAQIPADRRRARALVIVTGALELFAARLGLHLPEHRDGGEPARSRDRAILIGGALVNHEPPFAIAESAGR